jgi:phosphoserine phosphatase RsbU/P
MPTQNPQHGQKNLHAFSERTITVLLLDVCGHGIGAALLSISVVNALRSESLNHVDFRDPAQVLAELNQVFKMENHNDMFFTIWYGVYHKHKREIVYACGGHPPAIAMTGETRETAELVKLSGEGFIIGAIPEKKYASFSFSLKPFTRLYVFSDGIYEVDGCEGRVCMFDDFVGVMGDLYRDNRAHVEGIIDTMKARQGREVFDDDVSLLEIEFQTDYEANR